MRANCTWVSLAVVIMTFAVSAPAANAQEKKSSQEAKSFEKEITITAKFNYLLRGVAVWAFHGAKDDVVPIARTEAMIKAMKEAGFEPKFTIYPEAGHDSWTETYKNPELYKWFLEHKRTKGETR